LTIVYICSWDVAEESEGRECFKRIYCFKKGFEEWVVVSNRCV